MSAEGQIQLTILTPERRLVEKVAAREVVLTSSEGMLQILPGHAAFIGVLETGRFAYVPVAGTDAQEGMISTGFFEVVPVEGAESVTELHVVAETLELKGEIDVDRARKAQQAAEAALKEADLDESSFKKYQLKVQRSVVRQQVAGGI